MSIYPPPHFEQLTEERIVTASDLKIRLDKLLTIYYPHLSRTYFQELINKGLVLINGKVVKKKDQLQLNDEIEICFELTDESSVQPEPIALDVLYEDDDLIAINKPAGMVTHPAPGHYSGTFVNGLLYHCKKLPFTDTLRPGIVHRLDKQTSGVLIAAKTTEAHRQLVSAFCDRKIRKMYRAICIGSIGDRAIEMPIRRNPHCYQQMMVCYEGKPALSICKQLQFDGKLSLVEIQLVTGRTHQIRVHLQSVSHPVLGDDVYGWEAWNSRYQVSRQLLHAYQIQLTHPITNQLLSIEAPIPDDFKKIANFLTKQERNL